jgi:hypothetical protein
MSFWVWRTAASMDCVEIHIARQYFSILTLLSLYLVMLGAGGTICCVGSRDLRAKSADYLCRLVYIVTATVLGIVACRMGMYHVSGYVPYLDECPDIKGKLLLPSIPDAFSVLLLVALEFGSVAVFARRRQWLGFGSLMKCWTWFVSAGWLFAVFISVLLGLAVQEMGLAAWAPAVVLIVPLLVFVLARLCDSKSNGGNASDMQVE